MLLQNIIQRIQTGQGVGEDSGILSSYIAEQMNLRADLTDTDHIALAQRIRTAGVRYIYLTVRDQMQCGHRLPVAIYRFTLFQYNSSHFITSS